MFGLKIDVDLQQYAYRRLGGKGNANDVEKIAQNYNEDKNNYEEGKELKTPFGKEFVEKNKRLPTWEEYQDLYYQHAYNYVKEIKDVLKVFAEMVSPDDRQKMEELLTKKLSEQS